MQWALSAEEISGSFVICDALMMPADMSEQTESINNCNWETMVGSRQQSIFLASAALASLVAWAMYEAAKVSTQVKSQTRHWPDFHGAIEQLSGRLPSDLHRSVGSSVDGTLTAASDLCMMALIAVCLEK